MCCICFSNTLKLLPTSSKNLARVCCICFSNTLKHAYESAVDFDVCVVFVLAILSNYEGNLAAYGKCVLYLF